MSALDKGTRQGLLKRFFSRLRYPQVFGLLIGLFVIDFFLPDPLPFIDEAILALLAILLGMWKEREEPMALEKPPEKNVTPIAQPGPRNDD